MAAPTLTSWVVIALLLCAAAGTARADRDVDLLDVEDASNPDRELLQLQPDGQGIKVDDAGAIDNPENGRALLDVHDSNGGGWNGGWNKKHKRGGWNGGWNKKHKRGGWNGGWNKKHKRGGWNGGWNKEHKRGGWNGGWNKEHKGPEDVPHQLDNSGRKLQTSDADGFA